MKRLLVILAILIGFSTSAWAMFARPNDAPVDRLIKNAQAYIKENPKEAHGHYILGRIHYLAWHLKREQVPVFNEGSEENAPNVASDFFIGWGQSGRAMQSQEAQRRTLKEMNVETMRDLKQDDYEKYHELYAKHLKAVEKEGWKPEELTEEKRIEHALEAIRAFQKAIELKDDQGLYYLSLADLRQQFCDQAVSNPVKYYDIDKQGNVIEVNVDTEGEEADKEVEEQAPSAVLVEVKGRWLKQAMQEYRQAYELSLKDDRKLEHRPLQGIESLVSYNAIEGYESAAKTLEIDLDKDDLFQEMQKHKKKLEKLPIGAITPIIMSLNPVDSIDELLADDVAVDFDLDGSARGQRWPWLKPDAGLLVWDPNETGQITSGRQLFGSVSWWLFPQDGYHAMNLLDDNRDGVLAGNELKGLSLWFDQNQDGISGPGEVKPIRELPIKGIRVKAMSREGKHPMHPAGLILEDGSTLPTWDWIVESQ